MGKFLLLCFQFNFFHFFFQILFLFWRYTGASERHNMLIAKYVLGMKEVLHICSSFSSLHYIILINDNQFVKREFFFYIYLSSQVEKRWGEVTKTAERTVQYSTVKCLNASDSSIFYLLLSFQLRLSVAGNFLGLCACVVYPRLNSERILYGWRFWKIQKGSWKEQNSLEKYVD